MSRIGKMPIELPDGVNVTIDGNKVVVKGKKGELEQTFRPEMTIAQDGGVVTVDRPDVGATVPTSGPVKISSGISGWFQGRVLCGLRK